MEGKSLFIGHLAREAGVSTDTIRYYEHVGLLPRPGRSNARYRIYHPESLKRLRFIQKAQKLGFSLAEIKEVLDLRETGNLPCDSVIQMAQKRLSGLEAQLATLSALRDIVQKHLRRWKRQSNNKACAASQFCNLIEEIELAESAPKRKKHPTS